MAEISFISAVMVAASGIKKSFMQWSSQRSDSCKQHCIFCMYIYIITEYKASIHIQFCNLEVP